MEENISQPEKEFSPSSSPKQTIPNPKPKFSLILTGILLLVLGGVGGFLLGRQSLQPKSTTTTQVTPLPSETPVEERVTETPSAIPTLDPTAEWKTYENRNLSFKYPPAQTVEPYRIIGVNPNFIIYIASKDSSPLMNECMKIDEIEKKNNFVIKKFSRVTTGERCSTNDSSPREIWIVPTEEDFLPGIAYVYSAKDNPEAEEIFNLILSTFKFKSLD